MLTAKQIIEMKQERANLTVSIRAHGGVYRQGNAGG